MKRARAKEIVKLAEDLSLAGAWPNTRRGCLFPRRIATILVTALPEPRLRAIGDALGVNTAQASAGGIALAKAIVDFSDDWTKKMILDHQRKMAKERRAQGARALR